MAGPLRPHGFGKVRGREGTGRIFVPADRPKTVIALNDGWANLRESLLRPIIVISQVSQFNVLILSYVPLMPGSPFPPCDDFASACRRRPPTPSRKRPFIASAWDVRNQVAAYFIAT